METQANKFTEMAATRYRQAWDGFESIIRSGGSATLPAYCKSVHVNYSGMVKWMSASGLSVRRLRQEVQEPWAVTEENTAGDTLNPFVQFMPVVAPATSAPMRGVYIAFPDGARLTLQECSPEGIVTLLDTYERRRSAKEDGCSR